MAAIHSGDAAVPAMPRRASRSPSIDIAAFVRAVEGPLLAILSVVVLALLVLAIVTGRRIRDLRERLDGLTRGADGGSLEAILESHLGRVQSVAQRVDELSARSATLDSNGRRALQRVGLVRYNPFEETGGNQSFALALLDAKGNGIVLSSLHARAGTRIYGKSISAGRADAALSAEETEALRIALEPASGGS